MFNLYSVKKMTTISNARAIFLMEFRENTYIDKDNFKGKAYPP